MKNLSEKVINSFTSNWALAITGISVLFSLAAFLFLYWYVNLQTNQYLREITLEAVNARAGEIQKRIDDNLDIINQFSNVIVSVSRPDPNSITDYEHIAKQTNPGKQSPGFISQDQDLTLDDPTPELFQLRQYWRVRSDSQIDGALIHPPVELNENQWLLYISKSVQNEQIRGVVDIAVDISDLLVPVADGYGVNGLSFTLHLPDLSSLAGDETIFKSQFLTSDSSITGTNWMLSTPVNNTWFMKTKFISDRSFLILFTILCGLNTIIYLVLRRQLDLLRTIHINSQELIKQTQKNTLAEEKLFKNSTILKKTALHASIGIWENDYLTGQVFWSDELFSIFGKSSTSYIPTRESIVELLSTKDQTHYHNLILLVEKDKKPIDFELQLIKPDGNISDLWLTINPLLNSKHEVTGLWGLVQDLTSRKSTERELVVLNRALNMVLTCQHSIVRAKNEDSILKMVCSNITQIGGYRLVWIGKAEPDKTVNILASDGVSNSYLENITLRWDDSPEGNGPTGKSIKTDKVIISKDIENDKKFVYKEELLASGCHSAISIPIDFGDNTRGAMSIYSDRVNAFNASEKEILCSLGKEISFALSSLRTRQEYQKTVDALKISEDKFSKIFSMSPEAIGLSDIETGQYIEINEGLCNVTGYARDEVIGKSAHDLGLWRREQDRNDYYAAFNRKKELSNYRLEFNRKDGTVGYGLLSARMLRLHGKNYILSVIRDLTEETKNAEILRQTEEKYRLISDNMTEIVWLLDADLKIAFVNPVVVDILGYNSEELIGGDLRSILQEESAHLVANIIQNYANDIILTGTSNEIMPFIVRFTTKDGQTRETEITLSQLMEKGANSWLCVARDISERLAMENALKESEVRWQYALEGNGDGVWDWNLAENSIYLSPNMFSILGYPAQAAYYSLEEWLSIIHPDDIDNVKECLFDAVNGMTPDFHAEFRMQSSDGSDKWIMGRGKVISWDADNKPNRMVGTHTDITGIRAMHRALEESEEQFRLLAERSTDIISRLSPAGRFIYMSPACKAILGFTPEEMLKKTLTEMVHPEDRALVDFVMERVNAYQEISPLQYRMVRKQKDYIWVESTVKVIYQENGSSISEIQVTTRDISARVEAENALRESEEKLRSLINQSTDGIILLSEEGIIIEWSKEQERMTGLSATSVIGKPIWEVKHILSPEEMRTPEIAQQLHRNMLDNMQSGSPSVSQIEESTIQHSDGTQIIIQTKTFPIHTVHGYMLGSISRDITEIKKAELALHRSEENLRFITDHMMDMVCYVDQVGIIQYMSPSVQHTLGYSPQEMTGNQYSDYIHPDDIGSLNSVVQSGIAQKVTHIQIEFQIKNARGNYQWVESLVNILYDEQGESIGSILGTRDISKRKKAVDALRESEATYRTLARSFPNGTVMLFDKDLRFSVADGQGLYQLGLTREKIEGRTLSQVFPENISSTLYPNFQSALAGKIENFEMVILDSTHQVYTVPIRDEMGNITGGLLMTQDITDRKNAEISLGSRAQFLSILNEITRIVLETSNTHALIQQLVNLLGLMFQSDQCYITSWDEQTKTTIPLAATGSMETIYPTMVASTDEQTLTKSVLEEGQAIIIEDLFDSSYISRSLAERFPTRSMLALPLIGGGQKLGAVMIGFEQTHEFREEDVLEAEQVARQIALGLYKQKLLDEVRLSNLKLEKRVEERTADLEAKNKELETFTYSVSHDLKAPLRGIDGYSRLLMEDHSSRLDPEGLAFLQSIRQATTQMNRLIEDLLSYSRLERRALTSDQVDIGLLVRQIIQERQVEIDQKEITIKLDVPEKKIKIDSKALEQAIRNLVDNAIKFTSSARKSVILIQLKKNEGKYILIVSDNGIGFDMKYHEKVFDIFQRLHLSEEYPGTGIGLALVKKAMQRIGGKTWVESEPGVGSTFYLEFPGDDLND